MSRLPARSHAPPSAVLLVDDEHAALPQPRTYRRAHPDRPFQMRRIGHSPVSSPTGIKARSARSPFNLSRSAIRLRASKGQGAAIRGDVRSSHGHAISAPAPAVFKYHGPVSACFVDVCADTLALQSSRRAAVSRPPRYPSVRRATAANDRPACPRSPAKHAHLLRAPPATICRRRSSLIVTTNGRPARSMTPVSSVSHPRFIEPAKAPERTCPGSGGLMDRTDHDACYDSVTSSQHRVGQSQSARPTHLIPHILALPAVCPASLAHANMVRSSPPCTGQLGAHSRHRMCSVEI
ncbi:hypothetical protein POSPLADRAFT_1061880 [Postia placenta MAD-698-R-SB12]|uniref:Uncharacterized protein n=1 Tax=Postia placenta MAD-698-R-SB12 TaxID=670580 RepID=A0A1X6ML62_9APHY|nr:hypothetical protein POSPLADRAFT_1061880 [Postia placenta MAD-698-R-SB12]OSX57181.1 hypothetical protein POSPLADRAFT_1061880 [Postia placenta MAD-698-R-SB12]